MKSLITKENITAIIGSQPVTIHKSHMLWNEAVQAVKDNDEKRFLEIYNTREEVRKTESVKSYTSSFLTEKDGKFFFKGFEIHNVILDRIREFRQEGLPTKALENFLEKLYNNPDSNSIQQSFSFLEHNNLPLDEDGDFYAYKIVRSDYYDKHSGKFRNMIGDNPSEPRQLISNDPNVACARGLHVGGLTYSGPNGTFYGSGDHVMIVKVNPAHIVSVPNDHNAQKMRVESYLVVDEYKGDLPDTLYRQVEDEQEEDEFIDIYDLMDVFEDNQEEDWETTVSFFYTKSDGTSSYRVVLVDSVNSEMLSGYEQSDEEKFKNFSVSKISNLRLLDE